VTDPLGPEKGRCRTCAGRAGKTPASRAAAGGAKPPLVRPPRSGYGSHAMRRMRNDALAPGLIIACAPPWRGRPCAPAVQSVYDTGTRTPPGIDRWRALRRRPLRYGRSGTEYRAATLLGATQDATVAPDKASRRQQRELPGRHLNETRHPMKGGGGGAPPFEIEPMIVRRRSRAWGGDSRAPVRLVSRLSGEASRRRCWSAVASAATPLPRVPSAVCCARANPARRAVAWSARSGAAPRRHPPRPARSGSPLRGRLSDLRLGALLASPQRGPCRRGLWNGGGVGRGAGAHGSRPRGEARLHSGATSSSGRRSEHAAGARW